VVTVPSEDDVAKSAAAEMICDNAAIYGSLLTDLSITPAPPWITIVHIVIIVVFACGVGTVLYWSLKTVKFGVNN
jgi:Na+-translocating ferredoxin:NAD+ oxidoreductase RnfD subunit